MRIRQVLVAIALATTTMGSGLDSGALAQTQVYPPDGYTPLLFDRTDTKYVFRLGGVPWICRGDTFCKPIKIDGVADKDAVQATIEALGVAGPRYFLSYKQANLEKGKEVALSCSEERCSKLDTTAGEVSSLGIFEVKQDDRKVTRTALLRRLEAKAGRAQLLWCNETGCAELPLTRDSEMHLTYMGSGPADGRQTAWLRDKSGAVLSCAQPEEGVSDQLACEKTSIVLSDFPAATAAAATPAPTPTPAPAPAAPAASADADRASLAAAIDRAIAAGDFATADRLLADAAKRHAGNAAWPPLRQKLANARQAEARRLIAEARRFADARDFSRAEAMLQEADKMVPGFAETGQARAEIAAQRTGSGPGTGPGRDDRNRDRQQLSAAIDQALDANRLWEAERLMADYARRYSQDGDYRTYARRLADLRASGPYQARLAEARAHVASARQAMARNDFAEADRQLDLAERAAPGFPDVVQARADLNRRQAGQALPDDLRQLLAAIDTAIARSQYGDAERMIADGRRRYAGFPGWSDLSRRLADARRGPPPQTGNAPPPPAAPRNQ